MSKPLPIVKELTGKQLYYSFLAGAHKLFDYQAYLNKINVFPVPDGDTGTNLVSTFRSIIDISKPSSNLKETADSMADAALQGARGNSGIIFAQFLFGFSNEMKKNEKMDVPHFTSSIRKAVGYTYEAINDPVEGTMISVIREWADYLDTLKDKVDDFKNLLIESIHKAKQSLAETKDKLEVLKKANVVDAGAKGFVVFLEGIVEFFIKGELKKIVQQNAQVLAVDIAEIPHDQITYRYCTEAFLRGEKLDRGKIKALLKEYGDSIVIAGAMKKMRIHVHTDEPAVLFEKLSKLGTIEYQKVEDMVQQDDIVHNRKWKIALLTDSTADMPTALMEDYQIHFIPLNIHIDGNNYLDKLTITPQEFYQKLATAKQHPKTSQPSTQEFINKYNYLAAHYDSIITVNVSKALSGTFQNSLVAAKTVSEQTGKKISVINSNTTSCALGLLVLRCAKAIESGMSHEQIVDELETWIEKTQVFVSVKTIKYFIRGGRVSPMKGFIAKLFNLKPIISIDEEGKSSVFKKSFSRKGTTRKILDIIKSTSKDHQIWEYAVIYSNKEEKPYAEWYAKQLESIIGKEPAYIDTISPVVGANAGIGTVAVSYILN
ncbi:MAG: DegV family protein [Bacteroidota bacterium]|nr:DegV family protein [Bacteroidota bacterium]